VKLLSPEDLGECREKPFVVLFFKAFKNNIRVKGMKISASPPTVDI
jgi:hypothetical protein